jgi:nicotinamidase-related amidase
MDSPVSNPFQPYLQTPPAFQLDPNRTALLVVDMQYFDAHPDWGEGRTAKEMGVAHCFDPYFAQVDDVIPRIQQLLALFRQKQIEVVHLRVAEWTQDSRDVGWKQLVRGLVVPVDSKEAQPLVEVGPLDDELVVSKSSSGAFPVTNLDRLLRNIGIRTLIFTGTATGGCVESAVRDAVDLGYEVVVVADACADSTPASHQLALARMEGGLCRIWTAAQVASAVEQLADGDRAQRSGLERVKAYLPTPPAEPPGPEVNPYSLIFPPAIQLPLTHDNTALVLVDAIHYACDPGLGLGKLAGQRNGHAAIAAYYNRVEQALRQMALLLAQCRALQMRILHVRTAGHLPDGRDLSPHLRSQGIQIVAGTPEAEFMPVVAPQPGEMVIDKPGAGMFTGTGLDELLRNMGIEHLILTGISFIGGLDSSLRSATDRGYGALLVPDACAVYHPLLQEKLYGMQSGIIRVVESAAVVEQLERMPAAMD